VRAKRSDITAWRVALIRSSISLTNLAVFAVVEAELLEPFGQVLEDLEAPGRAAAWHRSATQGKARQGKVFNYANVSG
jgi:hypothetical protein